MTRSQAASCVVWIQNQIVGVAGEGLVFQPRGPAEPAGLAKARLRDLIRLKHELGIPEKVFAAVIEHPSFEALEGRSAGEQALEIGQLHGSQPDAKIKLRLPNAGADNGRGAELAGMRR